MSVVPVAIEQEREHALLSPSGAHRWMVCTPSARLEDTIPDKSSEYAEEGTLAHELAALKLEKKFSLMKPSVYKSNLSKIKKSQYYDREMESCTDDYVQHITELAYKYPTLPVIKVEQELDLSKYAPESFGTADCIILAGSDLHVIDFKYGRGVEVEAEGNEQMMLYALGAYERYKIIYQIHTVHMTIFQPRLGNVSSAQLLIGDLLEWGEKQVKPRAAIAWVGEGDFNPEPEACRFCRAKGSCKARAESMLEIFEELQPETQADSRLLSPERKGEILSKIKGFDKWIKDIEASALEDLLKGIEIKGWKAVEGRSNRRITDDKLAAKKLKDAGYKPSAYYERKLLGLTALESLVGKKELSELLAEVIEKPQGKPTLAEASDRRKKFVSDTPKPEEIFKDLQDQEKKGTK